MELSYKHLNDRESLDTLVRSLRINFEEAGRLIHGEELEVIRLPDQSLQATHKEVQLLSCTFGVGDRV